MPFVPFVVVQFLVVVAALAGFSSAALAQDAGRTFTLSGARILLPDGKLAEGFAVVVSGGRIQRVAEASEAGLPGLVQLDAGSVLSPGLIDLCSSIGAAVGAARQNVEIARAVDPAASAGSAIDPYHRNLRLALKAGITAAMVCPAPGNVISGGAVTFSTVATDVGLEVLRDDGPLVFALGRSVLRTDREPTSRSGARQLLHDALGAARRGDGHARLKSFLEGRTPGLVFCDGEPDVRAAFEVFDELGRTTHFVHNSDAPLGTTADFAAAVAARKVSTVMGPFNFTTPERVLRTGGIVDKAGAKVAFRGALPGASRHSSRATAALAVRHGMDPAAARRALTVHAAEVAGIADRTGAIAARKAADLVVFSGDPLRLDSRVLEVYVHGVRFYSAAVEP